MRCLAESCVNLWLVREPVLSRAPWVTTARGVSSQASAFMSP